MALTTTSDLSALDYSFDGSPFCQIAGASDVITDGLDYSFDGSPFWAIYPSIDFIPLIMWM